MTSSDSITSSSVDWSQEPEIDPRKEYRALIRSIQYTQGFGLLFVRCAPVEAERLIKRVQGDLGGNQQTSKSASVQGKTIEVLRLPDPIDNLYERIAALPNKEHIDVLFITGIEKSLISDIKPGYQGEGEYYNLNTLPRILGHLNLQRERFRDDFDICFIFLVPLFALKYFTRRAPDFFDWRSGVWEFGTNAQLLEQESSRILEEGDFLKYLSLSSSERTQKILEIRELLAEMQTISDQRPGLFFELGTLFAAEADYHSAIASFDQALYLKPNYHQAWYNRGVALGYLGRREDEIKSYDKALEIEPNKDLAWNNRGSALFVLGQYEKAIASYDRALAIQPNYYPIWINRGIVLFDSGRYEEAIASYDKALEIKPDDDHAWNNRGSALGYLGRHVEAIASFDKALKIKLDDDQAWYNRGVALIHLDRYEEAISSFDKALKIKPNKDEVWNNRGVALRNLGRYEEAIMSYEKALQFKPDNDEAWVNRGVALGSLGRYKEAISSYDKALELKPDDDEAWTSRGVALGNLGRYEEAISSYDKALELKPDKDEIWYNKACCYALQANLEAAVKNLSRAIALAPDKNREMAKTDSDFDSIRDNEAFQALLT